MPFGLCSGRRSPSQQPARRPASPTRARPPAPANGAQAFLVCRRSLPFWIATIALLAQGLDSNATLGAVTSAYKYGWWDGAVLPIGLGLSLIINGLTLAGPINRMHVLSVPEM